ncbi:hypothetical protein BIT34_28435, partial [Klebsiella pneumoniae]
MPMAGMRHDLPLIFRPVKKPAPERIYRCPDGHHQFSNAMLYVMPMAGMRHDLPLIFRPVKKPAPERIYRCP